MDSEAKFTKGPWVVDDANTTFVARQIEGVYHYICAVEPSDFSTDNPSLEEREANARLIAAAPDLYAALKALLDAGDGHDDFDAEWPAARAALSKATGAQT